MMTKPSKTNKYLIIAILLAVVLHGTSMFFTLEKTYDALIHLFFGSHYLNDWFQPWSYSWYTGFSITGYPPLVHQGIALFAMVGGLKFGLYTMALLAVILFITGVFRFSKLLTANSTIAGYASLIAVFSSSFVETLHLFGQLPSIIGIALLMHALPEVYLWIKTGKYRYLWTALILIAVTVTSHHVTPIFGMVFFIFPLIGLVLMDAGKDNTGSYKQVTFLAFLSEFKAHFRRIIVFGMGSLLLIILCILPYWINSKNNPITQIPIPHGSRDNFLEVTSSGLVFFVIPWGIILLVLPYIIYRYFSKRYLFFGIAFALLLVLGTGGTTPIPRLILGENAFNILTLDRFTLWASIMALPIFGELAYRFLEGDIKMRFHRKFGAALHWISGGLFIATFLLITVFSMTLNNFRPAQPEKIDMLPIINFLNQDQHDNWRYLPLGFGDQMAWLSAQTKATTVDGNYHSARRLPELTSRAVERLENSKYRGVEGIGSLQQFLTVPEKYHLKYVFSNDKFYDPLLYFTGWQRLQTLENGIMVWEREGVSPLPSVLPFKDLPLYQKLMWGTVPLSMLALALFIFLSLAWKEILMPQRETKSGYSAYLQKFAGSNRSLNMISITWMIAVLAITAYYLHSFYVENATQIKPTNAVLSYYDAMDFKEFEKAFGILDPESGKSLGQFMLEISVSDGLLSSYAKLDKIDTRIISNSGSMAKVEVSTRWITPLKTFSDFRIHELQKKGGKWFIIPEDIDADIPPNQLFTQNKTLYYNHGRRRTTTEQTFHEDVLKRPVLEVISARLVEHAEGYSIIGLLQNIDNIPADVSVKGSLFSASFERLASFNAKDVIKHKLLPKETTVFRVDFEDISWSESSGYPKKKNDSVASIPMDQRQKPVTFELQIEANVATRDLTRPLTINSLSVNEKALEITLFNQGIEEVTVPQLLFGFYDEDENLIWAERTYLNESIRPQRRKRFKTQLEGMTGLKIIHSSIKNVFVNGLSNQQITEMTGLVREADAGRMQLIPFKSENSSHLQIQLNGYIGNPK